MRPLGQGAPPLRRSTRRRPDQLWSFIGAEGKEQVAAEAQKAENEQAREQFHVRVFSTFLLIMMLAIEPDLVGHRLYPYRLRGLEIGRPDPVWASDVTYVRLRQGCIYLVATLDWFSRYELAWEVSVSLESAFCLAALEWALKRGRPEIFNTDKGPQFTSESFAGRLEASGIAISMDGRGRAMDNIFVQRTWRTVKDEGVYLNDYAQAPEAVRRLGNLFRLCNQERLHQALGYQMPAAIYFGKLERPR